MKWKLFLRKQKAHILGSEPTHRTCVSADSAVEHKAFLLLQAEDSLFDGLLHDESSRINGFVLTKSVGAVDSLELF